MKFDKGVIDKLEGLGYGFEQVKDIKSSANALDMYSPKFLFVGRFSDQDELNNWIKDNVKKDV